MSDRLAAIDVVVLAGGLGTRLAGVLEGAPKVLAPIDGQPYIAFLLGWLRRFGVRRVIFCLGHLAEQVEDWLTAHPIAGLTVETVREPKPAGTAGALRYAMPKIESDPVMVMNGDSFIDGDLSAFADDFAVRETMASVMCVEVPDCARFGRIELTAQGAIEKFAEKDPAVFGPGLINAGVYLFSRAFLESEPVRNATSMERDVFAMAAPGTIHCFPESGTFHDIGTPQSLAEAAAILAPYREDAKGKAAS